jgi:NAD(P)-dependent dehydrogenase (short-subunit alcohol dehydrogenase family)
MELGLGGKVVIVTGGSDGLGRALCSGLVGEGARVALCGRDPERLGRAEGELVGQGGDVLAVRADVTDPSALRDLVDQTLARWGRIDGVVNNAGRSAAAPVSESTDELWEADLELKLFAALRLTRLAIPSLRESSGAIVNVLAIAAKSPGAGSTPTSVSRAAGMALTKALSKELGPEGVRVNAVLIGLVESGQWERLAARNETPMAEFYEQMGRSQPIPLGRVGRASEFSDLVSFLLSERASYVTGTAVNLDGGLSAVV